MKHLERVTKETPAMANVEDIFEKESGLFGWREYGDLAIQLSLWVQEALQFQILPEGTTTSGGKS